MSDPDASDADFNSAVSISGRESTDEGSECDNTLNLDVVLPGRRGHPRGHRCRGGGGGVACVRDLGGSTSSVGGSRKEGRGRVQY